MDKQNLPTKDQEFKPQNVKVEVLQSEESAYFPQEQFVHYKDDTIKIEGTEVKWETSQFECNICDLVFTDEPSLGHHVNAYHRDKLKDGEEAVEPVASVEEQEEVDGNVNESERNDKKRFVCTGCTKSFELKTAFKRHLRVHSDERPYKCGKMDCSKHFKSEYEMYMHMKVHSDERPYKCPHNGCSLSYKRRNNLNVHLRLHTREKIFECHEAGCTKWFKSNRELKSHKLVHTDVRLFNCEEIGCTKSFKCKAALKHHMLMHTGERSKQCQFPGCNKWFKSQNHLTTHMKYHTDERRFKCEFPNCTNSFKTMSDLRRHMRVRDGKNVTAHRGVHNDKPTYNCKHTECSKTFRARRSLSRHMKVHGETVKLLYPQTEGKEIETQQVVTKSEEYSPSNQEMQTEDNASETSRLIKLDLNASEYKCST